ncbi:hypothetical protein J1N35_037881 [Gossypium stocksii]|uniref:Uncharacterized protein n=1 Tax=Gossypium stocksii TaxID=47602 RepID=A0A9D3UKV9_9ROSI|nr:hypothetical protein J1N35_037881 [Gossypium stocksii]
MENGDSTNHWIYDDDYERQGYEYPYVSYGYTYRADGYNQGLEEPDEDHYLTIRVSKLKESMHMLQADVLQIHGRLDQIFQWIQSHASSSVPSEQILEFIQCRAIINTPMEGVKHDIFELKDEGYSTVIKHDE